MPDDEKDRFGDKLRDAEKAKEDQFFAERERQLLDKLRARAGEQGAERPSPRGEERDHGETSRRRESAGWLARLFGRSR